MQPFYWVFFVYVGPSLSSKITTGDKLYVETCKMHTRITKLYEWEAINESEVEFHIEAIDLNKKSNISDIDTFHFKECCLGTINQL